MDFKNEINDFVADKVGGIAIIADGSCEVVYADSFFIQKYGEKVVGMDGEEIFRWLSDCPKLTVGEDAVEWESIDTDARKYYRFQSGMFEKEGKLYQIHFVTDITEYMGLNRDVTKYMSLFKKLSGFQTAVLEKLSDSYYELLPMLTDYFKTSKAYFFIQHEGNVDIITYSKMGNVYSNDRIGLNKDIGKVFSMTGEDDIIISAFAEEIRQVLLLGGSKEDSRFLMLCNGSVSGQKYAVYLNVWPGMDKQSLSEATLMSVIGLFVENGIMRERLVYESEHDSLTGLYNKGKYLAMSQKEYQSLDSIGVFNFDVNNLKVMNDTYGHEAGDKLLIKAANSIRKVTNARVHGYRMGGDEFLMIACNVSPEEIETLKVRWEEELARLNTADDGINCVIAAGIVSGDKGYKLDELMKQADCLMYEDKKKKKKPGEEIR